MIHYSIDPATAHGTIYQISVLVSPDLNQQSEVARFEARRIAPNIAKLPELVRK
jgi:hypothetical protein